MGTTSVFLHEGDKVVHEFYCTNCSGYITVKLDTSKNGAHCVHCPNCDHEHFRIIKDGVITEDRAPESMKSKDYCNHIYPVKAAYSKTSWELKLKSAKPQDKPETAQGRGFLGELWQRMAGREKN